MSNQQPKAKPTAPSIPSTVPAVAVPLVAGNNPDVVDADPTQPNVTDGPLEGQPLYAHPGYTFAGGNLGGQSTHVCIGCFALVQEEFKNYHIEWHVRNGS